MRIRTDLLWPTLLTAGLLFAAARPRAAPGAGPDAGGPDAGEAPAEKAVADPHKALLEEGWRLMHVANYPKAQKTLEEVLEASPDREDRAQALFALALLWQFRQPGADVEKAKRLYHEGVDEEFQDTRAAPWAMLALARLADNPQYEKDRRVEEARTFYERLLSRWPDHVAADEAAIRLAMTHIEKVGARESEDKGVEILQRHLARRPDNVMAAPMQMLLGNLAERREQYRRAIGHWTRADEVGIPGLSDRAAVYYKIAYIAERKLKDYRLAAKWYERIVNEIKRDMMYYVAKLSAERCRRLAGEAPSHPPGAGKPDGEEAPP